MYPNDGLGHVPAEVDDGSTKSFQGYRDNIPVDGRNKRRYPVCTELNLGRSRGSTLWMSGKCAVSGSRTAAPREELIAITKASAGDANGRLFPQALHAGEDSVTQASHRHMVPDMDK